MDNFTVISHVFNEEYLLPFWLEHHNKIFKNGIIINYLSNDKTTDIINKICPHWKVIQTQNIINNKPNFDAKLIDIEVIEIEKKINNYKICLNTTEYLFIDDNAIFDKNCYEIPVYVGSSSDDFFIPKNQKEFFEKIDLISKDNRIRGSRFLHNHTNLKYNTGRHSIFDNIEKKKDHELFIIHVGNYNLNKLSIARKMQIQHNIPLADKKMGFGAEHILNSEIDAINNILKIKQTLIKLEKNSKFYEIINLFINKKNNINIIYSELIKDASWGENQIILNNDVNLLEKTEINATGYGIFKIDNFNDYLDNFIKNKIYEITNKKINIEEYHNIINEEEHKKIINNMPYKKNQDDEFKIICEYLENYIAIITKEKVRIFNEDIWIRICRPNNTSNNDFNPYHRDIYLDFYKNVINIYLPIKGSNEKSSLTLQEGSHVWNENITMITKNGAYFKNTDKKYSVDAIVASKIPINMCRPNPSENEILLFSPYLIHGGATNENENITRFSLEIRFIRDDEKSLIQENNYREFKKNIIWR